MALLYRTASTLHSVALEWLPVLLVLAFLPGAAAVRAQEDETLISGSTCQSRNLTVRKRSPADGRIVFQFNGNAGEIPRGLPRASFRYVAQVNDYFGTAAATDLEAIGAVCNATGSYAEVIAFVRQSSGGTGRVMITPEAGGTLTLDDGTTFAAGPGAVAAAVEVTIESRGTLDPLDAGGTASVTLLPEGLTFSAPVHLTVPYVLGPATDDGKVQAVLLSTLHEPLSDEAEASVARAASILSVDAAGDRLTVALEHFSLLALFLAPEVVIAPHLPARFLRPGDLVFSTSGGLWLPGHVALFADSPVRAATLGQGTVVESTPYVDFPPACPGLSVGGTIVSFGQGVVERSLGASFLGPDSLFMGVRRPLLTPLTPARRNAILGYARSQIGKCYLPVGLPDPSPNNLYWSCSELAVAAHASAGVQDFVPLLSASLVWPYALFGRTAPVTDLTVTVGETVQIPIAVDAQVGAFDRYEANPPGSTLTLSGPGLAHLDPGTRTLTLAPVAADACGVHPVTLTATGPQGGTDQLTFAVAVADFGFSNQRPSGATTDRRPRIGIRVESRCGVPLSAGTLTLDGVAVSSFSNQPGGPTFHDFLFAPAADLVLGSHTAAVEVRDEQGNAGVHSFTFTVQGLPNGWVELGPYGFSATHPDGPVCVGYRVFGNVVLQGAPYYLCISLVRYGGPHNAGVGVTLGRNLSVHPLGETVQCFDTNTPLLQSALGLPALSPAADRWYQLQPWGVDATWWSDPPVVDVTFPVLGLTIPVSCSY